MHAPAVQAFLRWHQALGPEDRADIDAFLVQRGGRITTSSNHVEITFRGRRVGATPARPVAAQTPNQRVCPTCHQPLP